MMFSSRPGQDEFPVATWSNLTRSCATAGPGTRPAASSQRWEVPEWQRIEGSEQEKVPVGAVTCHIFLLTIDIHKLVFAAKWQYFKIFLKCSTILRQKQRQSWQWGTFNWPSHRQIINSPPNSKALEQSRIKLKSYQVDTEKKKDARKSFKFSNHSQRKSETKKVSPPTVTTLRATIPNSSGSSGRTQSTWGPGDNVQN